MSTAELRRLRSEETRRRLLPPPESVLVCVSGRAPVRGEPGETVSGLFVVAEEVPPPFNCAVWRLASDAVHFARAEGGRDGLFAGGTADPAEVAGLGDGWELAAQELAGGLRAGDAARVASGAGRMSVVAAAGRMPLTAAIFAEAAAVLEPRDGRRAVAAAQLARDRGDHAATDWWGRRGAWLARKSNDPLTAMRGYARAADAAGALGDLPRYVRLRRAELSAARRSEDADKIGRAAHSLLTAYQAAGDFEKADAIAPHVLSLYPPDHPRIFYLAQDLAFGKIERGDCASAAPTLRWLLGVVTEAEGRLVVAVNACRAAAGAADAELFGRAFEVARYELEERQAAPKYHSAWAYVETGKAAGVFGMTDVAERLVRTGRELARERGEVRQEQAAQDVLLAWGC
jgi:hypothetical protein